MGNSSKENDPGIDYSKSIFYETKSKSVNITLVTCKELLNVVF
jgi:hypothetical protein